MGGGAAWERAASKKGTEQRRNIWLLFPYKGAECCGHLEASCCSLVLGAEWKSGRGLLVVVWGRGWDWDWGYGSMGDEGTVCAVCGGSAAYFKINARGVAGAGWEPVMVVKIVEAPHQRQQQQKEQHKLEVKFFLCKPKRIFVQGGKLICWFLIRKFYIWGIMRK